MDGANFSFLISGSSHVQNVLIGVEYPNWCRPLYVYLLFAILLGQIKSKLNYKHPKFDDNFDIRR